MKKLDVGTGRKHFEDYTTLDSDPKVGADICVDILNVPVAYLIKSSFDEIRAFHVLEHLPADKRVEIMKRFFEWLKPGGILHIEVPIAGTPQFYQDPTHLSAWTERTFWYFTKGNKFGEAFAKRNSDARLFTKLEDETRNEWAYRIKFKK